MQESILLCISVIASCVTIGRFVYEYSKKGSFSKCCNRKCDVEESVPLTQNMSNNIE